MKWTKEAIAILQERCRLLLMQCQETHVVSQEVCWHAQHAGQCGVEVEGGRIPTRNWFLNLQTLTSGVFR